jgi:hypothetical protein
MNRNRMDRFIDGIEWLAAVFVGLVAADVFISVLLRYFFAVSIPDSYDRQAAVGHSDLLGHRGDQLSRHAHHCRSGLVVGWHAGQAADRYLCHAGAAVRGQRADRDAVRQVRLTYQDNVQTFDLRLPTWPFALVAWLGDVSAVLLIAVRTYRLIFHPEDIGAVREPRAVE